MIVLDNFIFHDEASAVDTGAVLQNIQGQSLTVAVTGTFTGTIKAQGKQGEEWFDLAVVDLSDVSTAESITAAGSYAVVGVEGFERLRCNLTAISAGSVTVTGRLCDEQGTALPLSMTNSGGGGGGGGFEACTLTFGTIEPTQGESPSFGTQFPLIILNADNHAVAHIVSIIPNENYTDYDVYLDNAPIETSSIENVLVGQSIAYTSSNFDNVTASGDITVEQTEIIIEGDGTLNLVVHEGK